MAHEEKAHFNDPDCFITFGVITVSDSCFYHAVEDRSGKTLVDIINNDQSFTGAVCKKIIVPDVIDSIANVLEELCDVEKLNVLITCGGTGFSVRDVTPEATEKVIERRAPALMTAITLASLKMHNFSMLSRSLCGIRKRTIIVNLPGSVKAVKECYDVFSPVLKHATNLLRDLAEDKQKLMKILKNNLQDLIFINNSASSSELLAQNKRTLLKKLAYTAEECPCASLENDDRSNEVSSVNVNDVASRPRESPFEMKSMDEAFRCVKEHCKTVGYFEKTVNYDNLHELIGYVLAEDICAYDSLPPFPASIKDGYAVIAADGKGLRKVVGASEAGSRPKDKCVESGSCIRINTGAPVPSGSDAVIQIEDTKLLESDAGEEVQIEVLKSPTVGQDIRPIGSDINKGDKVLSKNSVIGPGEIAAAATIGHLKFKLYRKPTVAVLTTGDEIVEPWKTPGPGQIRDCNKSGLLALFRSHGFCAKDAHIASDDPTALFRQLKECLEIADVLVITGGVSMGEKDFVKDVLRRDLGAIIHFGRLCMKPGKPTTFSTVLHNGKKRLIFGLPGNPVSAMVTAQLFVLPSLRAMSGHPSPQPTSIKAKLGAERKLDPRPEYLRVMLHWDGDLGVPTAMPTTSHQISSNVCSMVAVNGLAVLPSSLSSDVPKLEKGSIVNVLVVDKI